MVNFFYMKHNLGLVIPICFCLCHPVFCVWDS